MVLIKPMLFPRASDRDKMSRFCKGRLLAYLPDEPGCVETCVPGDVERYHTWVPQLAAKFPWLREDAPALERFLRKGGGELDDASSEDPETATGFEAPEEAGDQWASWFRAQQTALGGAAEDERLGLFGDDFDWVAEGAAKYSREDLRRAATFAGERAEDAAGRARVRTFRGSAPFAALAERQREFVRWGSSA